MKLISINRGISVLTPNLSFDEYQKSRYVQAESSLQGHRLTEIGQVFRSFYLKI